MLFWHLAQCRVAHIRQSMLRFSLCEQLQPTLRSEAENKFNCAMPSRKEETLSSWLGKIAIVIQFFCFFNIKRHCEEDFSPTWQSLFL